LNYSFVDGENQKIVEDLAKLSSSLAAYVFKLATGESANIDLFKANK
jgi:hypothetical protein